MRLWSLHPKYLDCKGLLAVWMEGLLAKKVLEGKTKGYKHHPQLIRFKNCKEPNKLINYYLCEIFKESKKRCYKFDSDKIECTSIKERVPVAKGQIQYELDLLKSKVMVRDRKWYNKIKSIDAPGLNNVFYQVPGEIESWEKVKSCADRESNPGYKLGKLVSCR